MDGAVLAGRRRWHVAPSDAAGSSSAAPICRRRGRFSGGWAGSGAGRRQAHCRAVGRRRGRLRGWGLPGRLERVERPLPRRRARLLARPGRHAAPSSRPASRAGGPRGHGGRRPTASINIVTVHDGFTLADLVSYDAKHNEANGDDNRDGTDDNRSWNCGAEGPTDDPAILELRARQRRNLLATLLLSEGVPMLLGGDELRVQPTRVRGRSIRLSGVELVGRSLLLLQGSAAS